MYAGLTRRVGAVTYLSEYIICVKEFLSSEGVVAAVAFKELYIQIVAISRVKLCLCRIMVAA